MIPIDGKMDESDDLLMMVVVGGVDVAGAGDADGTEGEAGDGVALEGVEDGQALHHPPHRHRLAQGVRRQRPPADQEQGGQSVPQRPVPQPAHRQRARRGQVGGRQPARALGPVAAAAGAVLSAQVAAQHQARVVQDGVQVAALQAVAAERSVDGAGGASARSSIAEFDFQRVSPPGGWRGGLPADARADRGDGPVPPETRGVDFFPYYPFHLYTGPSRPALAGITNAVQAALASGDHAGAIWTQGSPQIEETAWWFNLLIDTRKPIVGCAAQRPQGQTSHDGPQNIVDAARLIADRVWADEAGANRLGVVLVQDQLIYAAREVAKVDARPGGYVASGYGGVLGGVSHRGAAEVFYLPARKHTWRSDLRITRLPEAVEVVGLQDGALRLAPAAVLDGEGALLPSAIPSVMIVKDGSYAAEEVGGGPEDEFDLIAMRDAMLRRGRLAGFVAEGLSPYGLLASTPRQTFLSRAAFAGLPVVRVGRGNGEGTANPGGEFIAGSNLTSTKARCVRRAALMKLGSLPPAADPAAPTARERRATEAAAARYQAIFDSH